AQFRMRLGIFSQSDTVHNRVNRLPESLSARGRAERMAVYAPAGIHDDVRTEIANDPRNKSRMDAC
ncbi:MAG: hypothetical protein K0R28_2668, partial [Paenibacillus sp.]|nr:hypothetical protein [Paenibacillus sp.]